MRKSFDGLCGLVRDKLHREPLSGEVFVFLSRRKNQIRLLLWEGDGFGLYHKRLERGTYELPSYDDQSGGLSISRTRATSTTRLMATSQAAEPLSR